MSIREIITIFHKYHPQADTKVIERAYRFAEYAHRGQKRLSGKDYFEHCFATAKILTDIRLDASTIASGLLHDVIDDTPITIQQINKEFGPQIAFLVQGVSKLGKIKFKGIQKQVENLRKLLLAMAEDIRVILIKLADRLHNMQTLQYLPPEKQKRIALETLEIYAPIAYRLGMGEIKGQLEDLAFPYVYPQEYTWLMNNVKDRYNKREKYLKKIKPQVEKLLTSSGIRPFEIHSRAKHYYSLYNKLIRHQMDLSKIYDLVALRIIVETIEDCYAALGIIHKKWKPLIGRIKDYIALPKPNGYRSLHTTIFCEDGKITEMQIRTPQMHEEAEMGIAAHWAYVEAGKPYKGISADRKELTWVNQLRDWQKEITSSEISPEEFLESLKIDFLKDRIFVFTPKGDVIDLPEGATPIDFAYRIHTDLGHSCFGAKVDGKLTSLNTPLMNGQVVEIITRKEKRPSRDWLEIAKTNLAKNRIKNWLRKNEPLAKEHKFLPEKTKILVTPFYKIKKIVKKEKTTASPILVEGQDNIQTTLAHCCRPLPGDEIKGFVSINQKSVVVHRIDCPNLRKIKNRQQLVNVNWRSTKGPYQTNLEIKAIDHLGLIKEVSSGISNLGINIVRLNAHPDSSPHLIKLQIILEIENTKHLQKLIEHLQKINGIISVERQ